VHFCPGLFLLPITRLFGHCDAIGGVLPGGGAANPAYPKIPVCLHVPARERAMHRPYFARPVFDVTMKAVAQAKKSGIKLLRRQHVGFETDSI
jgi:hypothetical protein